MIRTTPAITALALAVLPSFGASASQDRILAMAPAAGTIVTYAGGGVGDGRPATQAILESPAGIAFDSAGTLYIADAGERRVRVVRNGIMTTLAGTGDLGTTGDGGPATAARFEQLAGVAVDGAGTVYVSDTGEGLTSDLVHGSVRRIDTHGVITTLAGNLSTPVGGLAVTPDGRTVYVPTANEVIAISTADGSTRVAAGGGYTMVDGGPATQSSLASPSNVALDAAGNLYIADTNDCRIREVSASSGIITTVLGGTGTGPTNEIGSGFGNGSGCDTQVLNDPVGVAVDSRGLIYASDAGSSASDTAATGRILLVTHPGSPGSDKVVDVGHSDLPIPSLANGPSSLGGVYAIGGEAYTTRYVYPVYVPGEPIAGQRGTVGDGFANGEPATTIELRNPSNVVSGPDGHVYITDQVQAMRIDPSGVAYSIAGTGASPPSLPLTPGNPQGHPARNWSLAPAAATADRDGNVYVADLHTWRVLRVDPHGMLHDVVGIGSDDASLSGNDGPALSFGLDQPAALLWANGALYVTDKGRGLVLRVGSDGMVTIVAGGGEPVNAALPGACASGTHTTVVTGRLRNNVPARQACLYSPSGLAMDAAGNLYFAEKGLNIVDRVTPSGILTAVAGIPDNDAVEEQGLGYSVDGEPATSAALDAPQGVAVDGAGNLYIADTGDAVIRKVDTSGKITTVVGDMTNGLRTNQTLGNVLNTESPPDRGDGGPASGAYLQMPVAVAVDAQGNLYIADWGDGRIREVGGIASPHAARDVTGGPPRSTARHRLLNRAW